MTQKRARPTATCKIEGCHRPVDARGWCNTHWSRWRKHGDPLYGGDVEIKGEPLKFLTKALAYRGDECLIWPFARTSSGYGHLGMGGRDVLAHQYVCEAFNGPKPKDRPFATHSCGNGHIGCVSGGHLSWKDHNGNMADMVAHGRSQRGERQWKSKLSASDIEKIKILPGLQREIADQFGITQSNVSYIRSGKTWKHLEPPPPATLEDYR